MLRLSAQDRCVLQVPSGSSGKAASRIRQGRQRGERVAAHRRRGSDGALSPAYLERPVVFDALRSMTNGTAEVPSVLETVSHMGANAAHRALAACFTQSLSFRHQSCCDTEGAIPGRGSGHHQGRQVRHADAEGGLGRRQPREGEDQGQARRGLRLTQEPGQACSYTAFGGVAAVSGVSTGACEPGVTDVAQASPSLQVLVYSLADRSSGGQAPRRSFCRLCWA